MIDRDDDESTAPPPAPGPTTISGLNDLPLGTKMRVRYGRGRNQREYEAKVKSQPEYYVNTPIQNPAIFKGVKIDNFHLKN